MKKIILSIVLVVLALISLSTILLFVFIYRHNVFNVEASEIIMLYGDVHVSRTSIAFNFINNSENEYIYGYGWRLYRYRLGNWRLPRENRRFIHGLGMLIRGGGVKQNEINLSNVFGTLSNGRYRFVRSHSISDGPIPVRRIHEYLIIEFTIDNNTPLHLENKPELPWVELGDVLQLVSYSELSPSGIVLEIENLSRYEFVFSQTGMNIFEPRLEAFPWRSIGGKVTDRSLVIPPYSIISLELNWSEGWNNGVLDAGHYKLDVLFLVNLPPPYPMSWLIKSVEFNFVIP